MNPRRLLAPIAAALLLAGCKDAPAPGAAPTQAAATTAVSVEAIARDGQGFSVGSTMSARTMYVFFDPQCPHCAALWQAARPLKSQARFVWLPVGLINESSTLQGAALLAAADPATAMDQHEASLRAQKGGILPSGGGDAQKEAVRKNTELMTRMGFASVPTVVGLHAQSGQLVTIEGSVATAVLAQRLGLQAPGG